jgi:hypothetical protein
MPATATKFPLPTVDAGYLADLAAAAAYLQEAKGYGLCDFASQLGVHRRQSEAETMVDQTVRAAALNLETNGEPYSFRDPNVFSFQGGGLADNATAYGALVNGGWFVEGEVPAEDVKSPPKKLDPVDGKYRVIYPSRNLIVLVKVRGEQTALMAKRKK